MNVSLPSTDADSTIESSNSEFPPETLAPDDIFQTLSNRRRRYALHYLNQIDEQVPLRELSEQIAAWESEISPEQVTPIQRKRTYTALHQGHLPKLDRLGIVEYNHERGTVRPTPRAKTFNVYLDVVPHNDIPWTQFYLAFGAFLTALVTVGWLDIPPFGALGGFVYAGFAALSVTLLGGYQYLTDSRIQIGYSGQPTNIRPPKEIPKAK